MTVTCVSPFFFFFSSRRRHTRLQGDWSSDVCSSDLKLAGMTGTAETEETEFYQIYKLEVVVIPTNRPVRRVDQHDLIYKTRREKYNAIMDEIERHHKRGLPVLVGTLSVDVSETLSRMVQRRGVPHEGLDAKYHEREAGDRPPA